MSKKNLIFLVVTILIVIVGILFFLLQPRNTSLSTNFKVFNTIFPQGETTGTTTQPNNYTNYLIDQIQPLLSSSRNSVGQLVIPNGLVGTFIKNASSTQIAYITEDLGKTILLDPETSSSTVISGTTKIGIFSGIIQKNKNALETIVGFSKDNTNPLYTAEITSTNKTPISKSFTFDGATDVKLSQDGNKIFYLLGSGNGVVGILKDLNNNLEKSIFSSPFSSWNIDTVNNNEIILTTKEGGALAGYMYSLNLKSVEPLKKIMGGFSAFTAKSNSTVNKIVYTKANLDSLETDIYDRKTNTSHKLNIVTLVDKCSWQNEIILYCLVPKEKPSSTAISDWYLGNKSFEDELWMIDVSKYDEKIIKKFPNKIDGLSLTVDESGNNFLIKDKLSDDLLFISK